MFRFIIIAILLILYLILMIPVMLILLLISRYNNKLSSTIGQAMVRFIFKIIFIIYQKFILCDIIKRINKKEVKNGTIRKIKRI